MAKAVGMAMAESRRPVGQSNAAAAVDAMRSRPPSQGSSRRRERIYYVSFAVPRKTQERRVHAAMDNLITSYPILLPITIATLTRTCYVDTLLWTFAARVKVGLPNVEKGAELILTVLMDSLERT